MGVPNSKFKGDSDYKSSYLRNEVERKSSHNKPDDHLVPEGSIESSTEKKDSYQVGKNNGFIVYFIYKCKYLGLDWNYFGLLK